MQIIKRCVTRRVKNREGGLDQNNDVNAGLEGEREKERENLVL